MRASNQGHLISGAEEFGLEQREMMCTAAVRIRLQRWTRTGNQNRKELHSLTPPLHKSIMSVFCLNCLKNVVKCLGDKLWGSTAVSCEPFLTSPCHTPNLRACAVTTVASPCLAQRFNEHSIR